MESQPADHRFFQCASGFVNEEFQMRELGIRHMCCNCALHNQKGPLNSQSAPESCEMFFLIGHELERYSGMAAARKCTKCSMLFNNYSVLSSTATK